MIPVIEIFSSVQGEGYYTLQPSVFVRLFGCNMTCNGFSNPDNLPTDPEPNRIPATLEDIDGDSFTKGCDSRYAWHPAYKHLTKKYSPTDLADEINRQAQYMIDYPHWYLKSDDRTVAEGIALLKELAVTHRSNHLSHVTWGTLTKDPHVVFTGGEPLLHQKNLVDLLPRLSSNVRHITFETNGSTAITPQFASALEQWWVDRSDNGANAEILFSVSPKLTISGEPASRRINLDAIKSMRKVLGSRIVFKVVCDADTLDEAKHVVNIDLQRRSINGRVWKHGWSVPMPNEPLYFMPLGATLEQENQTALALKAAGATNISRRLHLHIFGNKLGT